MFQSKYQSLTSILLLLISFNLFGMSTVEREHWEKTGLNFDYVQNKHLSSFHCVTKGRISGTPVKTALDCINGLNGLLSSALDDSHIILPNNYKSDMGKTIQLVANKYKVVKLKVATLKEEDYFQNLRELNEKKLTAIAVWRTYLADNKIIKGEFERITSELKSSYVTEENQLLVAISVINAIMVMTDYDHSRISSISYESELRNAAVKNHIGIGVTITIGRMNQFIVVKCRKDTGADIAGLKPNDRIIKIDGKTIKEIGFINAWNSFLGKPNSKMKLTIVRDDKEISVTVTRKLVSTKNVKYKIISNQEGDIGYVGLNTFDHHQTYNDMKQAIDFFENKNVKKIVFDLRNNAGGLIYYGQYVASLFLGANKKFGDIRYVRNNAISKEFVTEQKIATGKPLVILSNHGTASASEMFIGAMLHYKRALVVGTRSYGKGTSQASHWGRFNGLPNKDPSSLGIAYNVTNSNAYLATGESAQLVGIMPHFEISRKEVTGFIEIREGFLAFNPVPASSEGPITPTPPNKDIVDCVNNRGVADLSFMKNKSSDFQLLYAIDVANCMPQKDYNPAISEI